MYTFHTVQKVQSAETLLAYSLSVEGPEINSQKGKVFLFSIKSTAKLSTKILTENN
jgi:hypothetical protein